MKWLDEVRETVLLRRGVLALESLAKSQATLATIAQQAYDADHPPKRKVKTTFDTMDQPAINKQWEADRVAESLDDPDVV